MPPFLGEGAGSGMRDALNLSWKLDLVLRGIVADQILDTYQAERRPHVQVHVEGSIALAELACERDPAKAAERNENYRTGNIPPPPEEPTLEAGILHAAAGGAIEAPVGHFSPQGGVELDGRRGLLDDVIGLGFTLLGRERDPAAGLDDRRRELLAMLGGRSYALTREPRPGAIVDLDGTLLDYLEAYGAAAILIRPDFYVFGTATDEATMAALIDDLGEQLGVAAVARA
jgi:3-(3-hydroxy-phenyl)propionate hydroxylase